MYVLYVTQKALDREKGRFMKLGKSVIDKKRNSRNTQKSIPLGTFSM